jgi:hypothetical protein
MNLARTEAQSRRTSLYSVRTTFHRRTKTASFSSAKQPKPGLNYRKMYQNRFEQRCPVKAGTQLSGLMESTCLPQPARRIEDSSTHWRKQFEEALVELIEYQLSEV